MAKIKMSDILQCKEKQNNYDSSDMKSIFLYAKKIEGKTLLTILKEAQLTDEQIEWVRTKEGDKGLPGKIIEASYFGYELNSKPDADFEMAGVELKSTPADKSKDKYVAGETLSITQINLTSEITETFETSHLLRKLQILLLIFYYRNKVLKSKLDYTVFFASLFMPSEKDLIIIKKDYEDAVAKIKAGQAYLLSRRDGTYLGNAPKDSKNAVPFQPFYGGEKMLRRAFTLRKPYVQIILDGYNYHKDSDVLVKNIEELKHNTVEEIIRNRLARFIDLSIDEICNQLKYEKSKAKSDLALLTAHMLGLKQLRNEEFLKAGIIIKTIQFNENGINDEKFRLGDVDFLEIDRTPDIYTGYETDENGNEIEVQYSGWEDSELFKQLDNLRYLFVIFQQKNDKIYFNGSKLWSMSDEDIELAHQDWLDIKKIIKEGVVFNVVNYGSGTRTENNFPGVADARRIHLRPHGNKSFYVDKDGHSWGNGKLSDTEELPDGRRMVRQSYWLSSKFVRNIVKDLIK